MHYWLTHTPIWYCLLFVLFAEQNTTHHTITLVGQIDEITSILQLCQELILDCKCISKREFSISSPYKSLFH